MLDAFFAAFALLGGGASCEDPQPRRAKQTRPAADTETKAGVLFESMVSLWETTGVLAKNLVDSAAFMTPPKRRATIRPVPTSATFPIYLSLRVAAFALLLVAPLGLGLALLQARRRYRFRGLVDALVLLPLVLPPSVVGYFLVVLLGRRGLLGPALESLLGVRFVFSEAGAVVASAIVAFPILVKTAQPSLEAVPKTLEDVARSLGLGPFEVLFRVTLPLAWRGVLASLVLAFARAMGELGATLMLAGNIPGRTNTMSIEIFSAFEAGEDQRALLYVLVLTAISLVVVLVAGRLGQKQEEVGS